MLGEIRGHVSVEQQLQAVGRFTQSLSCYVPLEDVALWGYALPRWPSVDGAAPVFFRRPRCGQTGPCTLQGVELRRVNFAGRLDVGWEGRRRVCPCLTVVQVEIGKNREAKRQPNHGPEGRRHPERPWSPTCPEGGTLRPTTGIGHVPCPSLNSARWEDTPQSPQEEIARQLHTLQITSSGLPRSYSHSCVDPDSGQSATREQKPQTPKVPSSAHTQLRPLHAGRHNRSRRDP